MKAIKFGGAALRTDEGFNQALKILRKITQDKAVVVVSALGTSTVELETAAKFAAEGDFNTAKVALDRVIDAHNERAVKLIDEKQFLIYIIQKIGEQRKRITELLRGASITKELTPRTLDSILSAGEAMALLIFTVFMKVKGLKCEMLDATEFMITDQNHGQARPLIDKTAMAIVEKFPPIFEKTNIVITAGFVASAENGDITTMGKESSNLTATILAEYLDAKEVELYTDVEAIRSADPKITQNTCPIPSLDVKQADFLANFGLKLIYPDMLKAIETPGLSFVYKSIFKPEHAKTVISKTSAPTINTIFLLLERLNLIETPPKNESDIVYRFGTQAKQRFIVKGDEANYSLITVFNMEFEDFIAMSSYLKKFFPLEKICFYEYSRIDKTAYIVIEKSDAKTFINDLHAKFG